MICGNINLDYSLKELEIKITPIIEFGKKVDDNYTDIKSKLSRCKREYHNGKKSRTYDDNY